ncbi:MAG: leucyl aminopeptidase [bacterium]
MDFESDLLAVSPEKEKLDLVVYFVFKDGDGGLIVENLPDLSPGQLEDFEGKQGETQIFYDGEFSADRLLLLGGGKAKELKLPDLTELGGETVKKAQDLEVEEYGLVFPLKLELDREAVARELTVGVHLGAYDFDHYKHDSADDEEGEDSNNDIPDFNLLLEDKRSRGTVERGFELGKKIAKGVNFSRDLGNTPANELVPSDLATEARQIERKYRSVSAQVWNREALEEKNMNLIVAVGKGSENPPRLVKLTHSPKKSRGKVGLVGKGITFDTGGISIKPSKNMGEMKFDMCGAAVVLGVMKIAAELELPVEIVGYIPTAENMPSSHSTRPGDVVTGYGEKSVEILNTDAEGRLLLADTLAYLGENEGEELDFALDYATLTGACITALGHQAAALMSTDDSLADKLTEAGEEVAERVWQLPFWEEYSEKLKSEVADVKNIGGKAGTITGGKFLHEFVDEKKIESWAHLDIAGTAWGMEKLSYRPKGATGFGVRLTLELLNREFNLR